MVLFIILINSGPQHPATHGVLRSIAILHGEIIQWISPEIGLLHRGTEKLFECNYYSSNIGYFDRLDHVPGVIAFSLLFIILGAFSASSKYSMLGCIRITSQLISLELILTTILLFIIWSYNSISIAGFTDHYFSLLFIFFCDSILILPYIPISKQNMLIHHFLTDISCSN